MKPLDRLADQLEREIYNLQKASKAIQFLLPMTCKTCKKVYTDDDNKNAISNLSECLMCDHVRSDK